MISATIGFKTPNLACLTRISEILAILTVQTTAISCRLMRYLRWSILARTLWILSLADSSSSASMPKHDHHYLTVSFAVGQLNPLLQAQHEVYRHPGAGETHIRTLSYGIPAILTPIVDVVLPGTSFDGDLVHLQPGSPSLLRKQSYLNNRTLAARDQCLPTASKIYLHKDAHRQWPDILILS